RRSALRRDRFGFVFQSGQLVPELTAEENVALPLLLSGTRRGPAMTATRNWFGPLGRDGLEQRRSGELSGGQAQRVALAGGLVAGREVLFAGGPPGSLDSVAGGLLLTAVAATNAVTTWNNSHAWLWTGTSSVPAGPTAGIAPLWWHPSGDTFDGQQINRFDVAATGTSSPVPPGITHDPGPGQYYA